MHLPWEAFSDCARLYLPNGLPRGLGPCLWLPRVSGVNLCRYTQPFTVCSWPLFSSGPLHDKFFDRRQSVSSYFVLPATEEARIMLNECVPEWQLVEQELKPVLFGLIICSFSSAFLWMNTDCLLVIYSNFS